MSSALNREPRHGSPLPLQRTGLVGLPGLVAIDTRMAPGNDRAMRWRFAALIVIAALVAVPAAQAAPGDRATLERYAEATWASFVAMTDDATGLPTDILNADGTRVPQTSTTNIGAYMWSAVAAERLGIIGRAELVSRHHADSRHARAHGATRERPVLQLVRPPHGEKLTTWPPIGRAAHSDPVLGRQRLARHRPPGRAQQRPRARRPRRSALRLDGLLLYYRARGEPDPLPLRARRPARRPVLLRHARLREPHRRLHRDRRRASSRARPTTGAGAPSPTPATGRGRRHAHPASPARYDGVDVYEGSYPYGRHGLRPELGRLDVRGADAGAVRARGALGRRARGARTTRSRWTRRSTTA